MAVLSAGMQRVPVGCRVQRGVAGSGAACVNMDGTAHPAEWFAFSLPGAASHSVHGRRLRLFIVFPLLQLTALCCPICLSISTNHLESVQGPAIRQALLFARPPRQQGARSEVVSPVGMHDPCGPPDPQSHSTQNLCNRTILPRKQRSVAGDGVRRAGRSGAARQAPAARERACSSDAQRRQFDRGRRQELHA